MFSFHVVCVPTRMEDGRREMNGRRLFFNDIEAKKVSGKGN
jgi:hypothetical protein